MSVLKYVLCVIIVATAAAITALVLSQEAKGENGLFGPVSASSSYWSKNRGRSAEGKKLLATRVLIVAFLAEVAAMNFLL